MATEVFTGGGPELRPAGTISRFIKFPRVVRNEFRKVKWPTLDELKKATTVIVIFVSLLGLLIGLMDAAFQQIFVKLVAKLF
jgi:preprotein translocase SecE subunit